MEGRRAAHGPCGIAGSYSVRGEGTNNRLKTQSDARSKTFPNGLLQVYEQQLVCGALAL
jgi:hypothetical protein